MKHPFTLLASAMATLLSFGSIAQAPLPNRGCGTPVMPQQFEGWLQSVTPTVSPKTNISQVNSVFNIPVIVHVIHNNETINSATATTGGNLTAAQIYDQINILNKDFNGLNPDTSLIPLAFKPLLGKFQFNFCLAVVNPTGGILAEPGIDRVNRTAAAYNFTAPPYSMAYIDATVKPATIWNPAKYMNMWVCGISGGILGYATFPNPGTSGLSGLNPPYGSTTTDGLVMRNNSFGSIGTASASAPYNLGRTATHEIGHWLGLRHIWGDNGQCGATDYCNDTPPQRGGTTSPAGCNYGCPTFPLNANTCTLSSVANVNGDMFMNFMDYTNDACMYMFTSDQKQRAQLIMTNSPLRASLLTSTVCNAPTVTNEIGILYVSNPTYSQAITCSNVITPSVVLYNFGTNTVTSATFSYNITGAGTTTFSWGGSLAPSSSLTVSMPPVTLTSNGTKVYNVGVYAPNGGTDPYMANNVNQQVFTVAGLFTLTASTATGVCLGNTVMIGATGASTYSWNPTAGTGSYIVISPSASTIYTVTGTTSGCNKTATVSVTVSTPVTLTLTANPATVCAGSNVTLTALSSASVYIWNSGAPGTATSIVVAPATTTVYSVQGIFGYCSAYQTKTVSVVASPSVVANSTISCPGSTVMLGASGASTYSWSTGATTPTIIVSPSVMTIYTVTGVNPGCSVVSTKTVSVLMATVAVSVSNQTICSGGTATLSASGATTYSWSTGSTSSVIAVSPTTTTIYTVTGNNGLCSDTRTVSVTVGSGLSLNVSPATPSVCSGSSVLLTASGAGSYSWSSGATTATAMVSPTATIIYTITGTSGLCSGTKTVAVSVSSISLSTCGTTTLCPGTFAMLPACGANTYTYSSGSPSVNPSSTTSYTVMGSNLAGCTGSLVITMSVLSQPALVLAATPSIATAGSATICAGGSATLNASGAGTYSWSNGGSGTTTVVSPTVTTTYSVVGISAQGCTGQSTVGVIVISSLPLSVNNQSICTGGTATLSASGASTYSWSTGATQSTVAVSPAVSTVYTVTGTNGSCSNTQTVNVTVGSALSVGLNVSSLSICQGGSATLTASGAGTYTWSNGSNTASIVVSPTAAASYSIIGQSGSCTGTAVTSISISPAPTVALSSSASGSLCAGSSATLSATGAGSYSWSTGGSGNAIVVTPTATGIYTVTGSIGGCSSTATVMVSIGGSSINVTLNAAPSSICAGGTATLSASGAGSYTWSTGSNATAIVVSPGVTTTYSLLGASGSCFGNAAATISVGVASQVSISISPSATICAGKTVTITASGAYANYAWSSPSFTGSSIVVTPAGNTTYTVNASGGSSGCTTSTVASIKVGSGPVSVISATSSGCGSSCNGAINASTSGGKAPYTYSLSGSTCTSLPCTGLCPGLYTLYTIDSIGCSAFNILSISSAPNTLMANISATNAACGTCPTGVLAASISGGSGPYSYTWSPAGGNASTAFSLAPRCYTLNVQDVLGCTLSAAACVGIGTGLADAPAGISDLAVYPNPAHEKVTVEFNGSFHVMIYNSIGQLVIQQQSVSNRAEVTVSGMAKGIYLMEVKAGNNSLWKKLVID